MFENRRVLRAVLAMVAVTLAAPASGDDWDSPLSAGNYSKPLYGPAITAHMLKGRVVFLLYWAHPCPKCRAAFPRLATLQKKYASTGKFTVLASHVRSDAGPARKFCAKQRVNFPVYSQLNLPGAPHRYAIPLGYLFDHTGKIAARGHPDKLYAKVPAMVRAAKAAKAFGPISPMLEDVDLKHFKHLKKTLIPGRSIRKIVAQLERRAQSDDEAGNEAEAILRSVRSWISAELDEADDLARMRPAAAMLKADMLVKTVRGMPEGKDAEAILKPLKSDQNVAILANILKKADALKARSKREVRSRYTRQEAASLKTQLNTFLKRRKLSAQLKDEAKKLLESLEEKKKKADSPEDSAPPGPGGGNARR